MKEIVITSQKIKKERNFYLLSFALSFIINIIAVIVYNRPWIEIGSQIGYVVAISFFIYFVLLVIRLLLVLILRLFRRRKRVLPST